MVAFQRLEAALGTALAGEVCFDDATRTAYASDASNYRQVPVGVVVPRSVEDVVAAVALWRSHAAAVLPRGAGTSMCGQSVNAAVVIDCSKYLDRVLAVDPASRTARVEPGAICDTLREVAAAHGNNSCGPHLVMAGKTVENIERLEVLTYDGARFWCGPTEAAELARVLQGRNQGPAAREERHFPDTGCCGMAGAFGYRPEFYQTSRRIAQLALLPALEAAPDATVLASGFSCREQIEGLAGRRTLHLAELLAPA
jgi:FAD/FMN-containing dehydrogenase